MLKSASQQISLVTRYGWTKTSPENPATFLPFHFSYSLLGFVFCFLLGRYNRTCSLVFCGTKKLDIFHHQSRCLIELASLAFESFAPRRPQQTYDLMVDVSSGSINPPDGISSRVSCWWLESVDQRVCQRGRSESLKRYKRLLCKKRT